ncbi:MAG: ABC transporter permease [Muribaculum sp.]|nr:ABC transporter permease [Muribaculum sp.]
MGNVSALLALRFLGSKKSHGAVSAVTAVSVIGVAVATAAIICVLSVFNGFRDVLYERLDSLTPDVTVMPNAGKSVADGDSLCEAVRKVSGVDIATPVVEDQALILYNSHEMPVKLRGVDMDTYRRITALDSVMIAGDAAQGVASIGTAVSLGSPQPGDVLTLFAPRREGRINLANPASSFFTDSIVLGGVYQAKQSEFDKDILIVPLDMAKDLFQYDSEATRVIVKAGKGVNAAELAERVQTQVGPAFKVLDRGRVQSDNSRMVNIEKWVTFLLLFFIVLIAGFNIISTLSMLVLEKDRQLSILSALGLPERRIGHIFGWESFYVTAIGGVAGILLGLGLCLVQQHFGLLKLSGDPSALIYSSYPVRVVWTDIPLALIPLAVIGLLTALTASSYARRLLKSGS